MEDEQVVDIEESYSFHLEQFDGPLDLLLHLIKDAKIDIKDIFVSKITEQYLLYIQSLDAVDMDKAGAFIEMAATLLEIKSKKLLPKIDTEIKDEEDPEVKLIRQVEEYKLFKEASEKLKPLEDVSKFYKDPEPEALGYRYVLKDMRLDGLISAFAGLMHKISIKSEEVQTRKIEKDRFTVAEKISQIKDNLLIKKQFMFTELFEKDYSKSEIINTFLAVLELLKIQVIKANQNDTFDDIVIKSNEENLNE
ncbi:MAG: segregation/condensation protein A [Clostridia bacterium]